MVVEKSQRFDTFQFGDICQHNFQKTHSLRGLPDTLAHREGALRGTDSPFTARNPYLVCPLWCAQQGWRRLWLVACGGGCRAF